MPSLNCEMYKFVHNINKQFLSRDERVALVCIIVFSLRVLILGIYTSYTHVHWVSSIPHLIALNYGNNRAFTCSKIYTSRQTPQGLYRTVCSRRRVRLVT